MATPTKARPSLESGDRLTRREFHERYSRRPDLKKVELVKGVVYVPSPIRFDAHAKPLSLVHLWLGAYAAKHPDLDVGDDATVLLSGDTEVQPDAVLIRRPEAGGTIVKTDAGYLEGAPDLVVEVAASSAAYDLHDKKQAYEAAGVREYVVWRVEDGAIDWFVLREDRYEPAARSDGSYVSTQFPGLRLEVDAMLAGDRARLLQAIQ